MASSNFRVKNGIEVTEVLYVSGASSLRNLGVLGPVDPDVAGITVHGDISATGTIFVAGSASGGTGGGGDGANGSDPSTAGTANTGGGGGGVNNNCTAGNGGSGIVIIRYKIAQVNYE